MDETQEQLENERKVNEEIDNLPGMSVHCDSTDKNGMYIVVGGAPWRERNEKETENKKPSHHYSENTNWEAMRASWKQIQNMENMKLKNHIVLQTREDYEKEIDESESQEYVLLRRAEGAGHFDSFTIPKVVKLTDLDFYPDSRYSSLNGTRVFIQNMGTKELCDMGARIVIMDTWHEKHVPISW